MTSLNGSRAQNLEMTEEQFDAFQSTINMIMGMGSQGYDPLASQEVDTNIGIISDIEISALYAKSRIVKRIVNVYPTDAAFGYPILTKKYGEYNLTAEKISDYLKDKLIESKSLTIENAFRDASKKARKWGIAYIVMGIRDGLTPDQPINENNIESFDFLVVRDKFQLRPNNYKDVAYYELSYDFTENTERKALLEENQLSGSIRIHPSRVLAFYGEEVPEKYDIYQDPLSSIQASIGSFMQRDKGLGVANQLLTKKAILWAKLQIMAGATAEIRRANLEQRLWLINLQSSIYRMIGMNQEEELGATQIDLNNVDKVLEANDAELLNNSGIVRYKLFGQAAEQTMSQASAGIEQKADHADRCTHWAKTYWYDNLMTLYNLVCLAKDAPTGGKRVKNLDIEMITYPQLSPAEWALMRKDNTEWAEKMLTLGTVTKAEIRQAFFSGIIEKQLVPNLELDERVTKMLQDEAVNPPDQALTSAEEQRTQQTHELSLEEKKVQIEQQKKELKAPIVKPQKDELQTDDSTPVKRIIDWRGYKLGLQYLPFDKRHNKMLPCAYGHIQRTKGSDGMAIDCYVNPRPDLEQCEIIYKIDQRINGEHDEYKYMIGFDSAEHAADTYKSIMPPEFLYSIEPAYSSQFDMLDDAPNYRDASDGKSNSCATCQYSRVSTNNPTTSKTPWMNCDLYDFDIQPYMTCDSWEESTQQNDAVEGETIKASLKNPKVIDEILDRLVTVDDAQIDGVLKRLIQ